MKIGKTRANCSKERCLTGETPRIEGLIRYREVPCQGTDFDKDVSAMSAVGDPPRVFTHDDARTIRSRPRPGYDGEQLSSDPGLKTSRVGSAERAFGVSRPAENPGFQRGAKHAGSQMSRQVTP